ncbi:MAG: hypothetical protein VX719_03800 [Pseudomonadota bacterium]|nr:hypothetical protein [Pseudomonadota bacterium]
MSIRLLAAACFLIGAAPAIAQSTLPVPSGFYPIEGTEQPFYIKKDSIRENVMDREATTVALVMTFVSDAQGNRGYAVGNYIAWCGSKRLYNSGTKYFTAEQQLAGSSDKSAGGAIFPGTDNAIIHARLCSEWDETELSQLP